MGVKQAARHSVVAAKERENDEFITASIEETISGSPLTKDFDDVMDWVFGHNPMDNI